MTGVLLERLWSTFSTKEFPSEWDGLNDAGGKLSQRFWEYMYAAQKAELGPTDHVLDIGGACRGYPDGIGFFAKLIAPYVGRVTVVDPDAKNAEVDNVISFSRPAFADECGGKEDAVDVITCISVLEHMPQADREEMMSRINACTSARTLIVTCEYHPVNIGFDYQLTMRHLGDGLGKLTNFYCDDFSASPTLATNAFADAGLNYTAIPRWYPVGLRFRRKNG